jgi:hypothetical protein
MGTIVDTQGEPVFAYVQDPGLGGAYPATFYTPDFILRTLQPWEQFILDTCYIDNPVANQLFITCTENFTSDSQIMVLTVTDPVALNDADPAWGTLMYDFEPNGLPFPVGQPPVMISNGNSESFFGVGRIVNGTTQGSRPNWRERLIPGIVPASSGEQ